MKCIDCKHCSPKGWCMAWGNDGKFKITKYRTLETDIGECAESVKK